MNNKDSITHKELLAFSNLTNLEWEFADLEISEEVDEDGNIHYEYSTLNELLTPEEFARTDDEGEIIRHTYGKDDKGNYLGEEAAKKEMRKEAGIAMEYCI